MGAWSAEAFDNDTALDFVDDLLDAGSPDNVERALRNALHPPQPRLSWWHKILGSTPLPEDSETGLFEKALAAAEIIALWHGHPLPALPERLEDWAAQHRSTLTPALLALARQVVRQAGTESELKDSWEADGIPAPEWHATLADLQHRLS